MSSCFGLLDGPGLRAASLHDEDSGCHCEGPRALGIRVGFRV